ncbi:MAG: hypothetical protein Q9M36_10980 [Sulfurovum sp.]|nr:hypothetical protein [Sulfurovum sp.]
MQKPLPKRYSIVVIAISSPLLLGVYEEDSLIETISSEKKTSEILLPLLLELLDKYAIHRVIYTRGPGSYMAIKLTYIMLKTLEITRGIQCFGCSGFSFNGGKPIKAIGNLYFFKEKETIMTQKYEQQVSIPFVLSQSIQDLVLDDASIPEYHLPAV